MLAERNMKAKKLSLLTGIAQSTLTRINNNNSAQIDYDTLNKICNQLQIEPMDFFDYTPYDFEVSADYENGYLSIYIKVSKFNLPLTLIEYAGKLTKHFETIENEDNSSYQETIIDLKFSDEAKNFVGFLNSNVNDEDFKKVSVAIKQVVFQDFMDVINAFILGLFDKEVQDEIQNTIPLLDSQNEVNKYMSDLKKSILSRLNTNLSFYGIE